MEGNSVKLFCIPSGSKFIPFRIKPFQKGLDVHESKHIYIRGASNEYLQHVFVDTYEKLFPNISCYLELFTPGSSPAYLFEVVFVKCVCIWRTSVFFQFYGVLSGVIYNYSSPTFFYIIRSHTFTAENCAIGNIVK